MTTQFFENLLEDICAVTGADLMEVKSTKVQKHLNHTRYLFANYAQLSTHCAYTDVIANVAQRCEKTIYGWRNSYHRHLIRAEFWALDQAVQQKLNEQKKQAA